METQVALRVVDYMMTLKTHKANNNRVLCRVNKNNKRKKKKSDPEYKYSCTCTLSPSEADL